jgi:hypothetical protein
MKTSILNKLKQNKETMETFICQLLMVLAMYMTYYFFSKAILQTTKERAENELEFLESSINPNQCGCSRCPSCNLMQRNRISELKQTLDFIKKQENT